MTHSVLEPVVWGQQALRAPCVTRPDRVQLAGLLCWPQACPEHWAPYDQALPGECGDPAGAGGGEGRHLPETLGSHRGLGGGHSAKSPAGKLSSRRHGPPVSFSQRRLLGGPLGPAVLSPGPGAPPGASLRASPSLRHASAPASPGTALDGRRLFVLSALVASCPLAGTEDIGKGREQPGRVTVWLLEAAGWSHRLRDRLPALRIQPPPPNHQAGPPHTRRDVRVSGGLSGGLSGGPGLSEALWGLRGATTHRGRSSRGRV